LRSASDHGETGKETMRGGIELKGINVENIFHFLLLSFVHLLKGKS
jgi:hypothetical protein